MLWNDVVILYNHGKIIYPSRDRLMPAVAGLGHARTLVLLPKGTGHTYLPNKIILPRSMWH
jgi:hypothetical protein